MQQPRKNRFSKASKTKEAFFPAAASESKFSREEHYLKRSASDLKPSSQNIEVEELKDHIRNSISTWVFVSIIANEIVFIWLGLLKDITTRNESPAHKKSRKIMSRIEWIAQIREIYSDLITTHNREYFSKESVIEMLCKGEAVSNHTQ